MNRPARGTVELEVLSQPERALPLLEPLRRQILEQLDEPDSAAGVARRLRMPRQKINYHLRELERAGLVELSGERRRGNCTERLMRRSARSFVISPEMLGPLGAGTEDAERPDTGDRFSWSYLVGALARAIRELGGLRQRAVEQERRLPTFTLESEIRFRTPGELRSFADELSAAMADLIEKYHCSEGTSTRGFRWLLAGYPAPGAEAASGDDTSGEGNDDE